jgi:hypothetical protein
MAKDKYDFIQEILLNQKLSTVQRERIFILTKEEIKKDKVIGKVLDIRIKKLEDAILDKVTEINKDHKDEKLASKPEENNAILPKYFYPTSLYKYLLKYNQNPILKSTCHEIDSEELKNILNYCGTETYSYEKHLEKIIEAFNDHDKKYFAPSNVKALIKGYLTGKDYYGVNIKGWSSNEFPFNWSSVELKRWCLQNQGVPPNIDGGLRRQIRKTGFEFNPNIKSRNGILIQNFSDLVIYFKRLFHIKSDNSFKNIIKEENKSRKWNAIIDFEINDTEFPTNIEFFTDVDKFVQAYNQIIELIIDQNANKDIKASVKLSLTEKEGTIEFSVLHQNNLYGKTIMNATDRLGTTYQNIIKNLINGLCNFYIQADFEKDGPYKIDIWNKPNLWVTEKPTAIKLDHPVGGVEHIFEIIKYKSIK